MRSNEVKGKRKGSGLAKNPDSWKMMKTEETDKEERDFCRHYNKSVPETDHVILKVFLTQHETEEASCTQVKYQVDKKSTATNSLVNASSSHQFGSLVTKYFVRREIDFFHSEIQSFFQSATKKSNEKKD